MNRFAMAVLAVGLLGAGCDRADRDRRLPAMDPGTESSRTNTDQSRGGAIGQSEQADQAGGNTTQAQGAQPQGLDQQSVNDSAGQRTKIERRATAPTPRELTPEERREREGGTKQGVQSRSDRGGEEHANQATVTQNLPGTQESTAQALEEEGYSEESISDRSIASDGFEQGGMDASQEERTSDMAWSSSPSPAEELRQQQSQQLSLLDRSARGQQGRAMERQPASSEGVCEQFDNPPFLRQDIAYGVFGVDCWGGEPLMSSQKEGRRPASASEVCPSEPGASPPFLRQDIAFSTYGVDCWGSPADNYSEFGRQD